MKHNTQMKGKLIDRLAADKTGRLLLPACLMVIV